MEKHLKALEELRDLSRQTSKQLGFYEWDDALSWALHRLKPRNTGKLVYVCSPLRGDIENNIKRAAGYCSEVTNNGNIPIAPHVYFTTFLDDNIPEQRTAGMAMGMYLLETMCDEIWIFGNTISEGMRAEIKRAQEIGKPIKYMEV